jgi:prolyl-tRNA synthetase
MAHAWNTSWGVSTRMIGGLVMTHSDDNGLVCPPKLAPIEVVIIPIWKSDDERARVVEAAHKAKAELTAWTGRDGDRLRVHVDAREGIKPGAKYYEWELRGIPLRLEIGPKDLEKGSVFSARRDTRAKAAIPMAGLPESVAKLLATIQADLLAAAEARREANSHRNVTSYAQFKEIIDGPGGFVYAGWNGDPAVEAKVKEETKATIRVIPDAEFRSPSAPTKCLVTGEPAKFEVVWAKAY